MTVDAVPEILTQPERRRRWTSEQKLALVAETLRSGASTDADCAAIWDIDGSVVHVAALGAGGRAVAGSGVGADRGVCAG